MIGSSAVARSLERMLVILIVVAFCFGGLSVWGLPKLWALLRPWIHQVTA